MRLPEIILTLLAILVGAGLSVVAVFVIRLYREYAEEDDHE
jgi:hypothetical protein